MQRRSKTLAVGLLLAVFFLGVLAGAQLLRPAQAGREVFSRLDVFARVLHYVQTNYVDPVDDQALIYGAIAGMLDTLDPHTVFMPPDIYQEVKNDTAGEFHGLGLVLEGRQDHLHIVEPVQGGPAQRAGLLAGDRIFDIDSRPVSDMSLSEAVGILRGRIGSTVTLTLQRDGLTEPFSVTLMRARVTVPSVSHRLLKPGIGYVQVASFQDRTEAELVSAIKKLSLASQSPLSGLVLDLRNNSGGLFTEAVRMADQFIRSGLIVSTEGRNRSHIEREEAHDSGAYLSGNLVVLINGGTASASEIVAGALKDHKRAVLIGSRTFGKGSVQNIIDLDDGSGLKITVARYYTPNRQPIDPDGISPDVQVAQPDELRRSMGERGLDTEDLPVAFTDAAGLKLLESVKCPETISAEDHQLLAAYAYLLRGRLP